MTVGHKDIVEYASEDVARTGQACQGRISPFRTSSFPCQDFWIAAQKSMNLVAGCREPQVPVILRLIFPRQYRQDGTYASRSISLLCSDTLDHLPDCTAQRPAIHDRAIEMTQVLTEVSLRSATHPNTSHPPNRHEAVAHTSESASRTPEKPHKQSMAGRFSERSSTWRM